jgi:glycosyltransferase involved in cell wall biosynthesis
MNSSSLTSDLHQEVGQHRRLFASSSDLVSEERFDLLVHALAQLPDEVALVVWGEGPDRARLEMLAGGYSIADRLSFTRDRPKFGDERVIYPTVRNARSAPLRPPDVANPLIVDLGVETTAESGVITSFAQLIETLRVPSDPPSSIRGSDEPLHGHRIAIVTNVPTHYRVPLFNRLAARLERVDAKLRVFFLRDQALNRPWLRPEEGISFDSEVVHSFELPIRARRPSVPLDLKRRIMRFGPSVLIVGGFSPLVAARVANLCTSQMIPCGVWSGEPTSMAKARSWPRRLQRSRLTGRLSFGLAYGSASAEYLYQLNPHLPVIYARNTSGYLADATRKPNRSRLELVAVGDLGSPRKGTDIVIDALKLLPDLPLRLSIVGSGRLLPALTRRSGSDHRIRFLGPMGPGETRKLMRNSDVFLFPSRADVFGLVLPEAMAAGLCVITSSAPGGVRDLCVSGHNSLIVESHEPEDWATALRSLASHQALRLRLAAAGRETVASRWTMDHAVDGMIAGLRLAIYGATARERNLKGVNRRARA